MAKVFIGDQNKVDQRVLSAVQTLPDDFWVLGEFNLLRNYDWVIIRPVMGAPATVIAAEIKRVSHALRGSVNGVWEKQVPDGTWEPVPTSHANDRNGYWQAVNAANSLSEWLRNNEPVFNEGRTGVWSNVRVWPDLVLLSPIDIRHQLPIRPDSGFGMWFYELDRWVDHVLSWKAAVGPVLSHADVERLVRYLDLQPYGAESRSAAPREAVALDAIPPSDQLERVLSQINARLATLDQVEVRLAELERLVSRLSPPATARASRATAAEPAPAAPAVTRGLNEDERTLLATAVSNVRAKGKGRSIPTLLAEIRSTGPDLKSSDYLGFGTAKALLNRAATRRRDQIRTAQRHRAHGVAAG